jgi:glycosyltransferase involved in cell wall biosynthesis
MAKVTVVIPVYNSSQFLKRLFSALDNQIYKDFSVIFVYDKSLDRTLDLIESKMSRPYSVKVLKNPIKSGVGSARDFALDSGLVRSDYVWFLDADDFPHKDFLEKMVASAEKNQSDISICGFSRYSGKDGHLIAQEMLHNPEIIDDIFKNAIVPLINPAPWNKLYRTSCIKDARFIYQNGEDGLFLLKVLPNCRSVSFVNESLYDYFVNPNSVIDKVDFNVLKSIGNGFVETKSFFESHGGKYKLFFPLLEAFVFLRLGIGETTRACLHSPKQKRMIIKSTRQFLDLNFAGWRHNHYWSFHECAKGGLKRLMVWRCRYLYKIGLFGLFVCQYSLFTRLFKKDIKW